MTRVATVGADGPERVVTVRMGYLPWQREVRRAVFGGDARTVVLACGARSGKGVASAMMLVEGALRLALKRPDGRLVPKVNCWVVAPNRKLWTQSWGEVNALVPDELVLRRSATEGVVELLGGVRIAFKASYRPEDLVAEGVDILWFTEASRDRSTTVWGESLLPRLASPGRLGLALVEGTPRVGKRHWFRMLWETAHRGAVAHLERNLPTSCNPLMCEKLAGLAEAMPERLFRTEILAMWPDDDEKPFRSSDVDAAWDAGGDEPVGPYVSGLDVARWRDATFGLAAGSGGNGGRPQVCGGLRLVRQRQSEQVGRIVEWQRRWPGCCMVDATGVGAYMADALEDAMPGGSVRRVDLNGGRKELMLDGLIAAFERRELVVRGDLMGELGEVLKGQLDDFEAEVTDDGRVDYHGPGGHRDDGVIALALLWHRAARLRGRVDAFDMVGLMRSIF